MTDYLIDHTREYLTKAAEYVNSLDMGDGVVQILAQPAYVAVRACGGGILRAWQTKLVAWEDIATAKENPIIPEIDAALFLVQRHGVGLGAARNGITTMAGT